MILRVFVCMCGCMGVGVLSSHLFWTSDLWTHQRGSHRRNATQEFFVFISFVLFVFFLRYRQVRYGSWSCFHFCAVNLSRCFLCLYTSFLYLFHLFVVSVSSSCVFILLCVSFVATVLVFLPGMYRSVPLLIELPCLGSLQTRIIFLPYA